MLNSQIFHHILLTFGIGLLSACTKLPDSAKTTSNRTVVTETDSGISGQDSNSDPGTDGKKIHQMFCQSCHGGINAHAVVIAERHGNPEKNTIKDLIAQASEAVPSMASIKLMPGDQLEAVSSALFTALHEMKQHEGDGTQNQQNVVGHQTLCFGCHGSAANHASVLFNRYPDISRTGLAAKTIAAVFAVPDMSLLKSRPDSVLEAAANEVYSVIETMRKGSEPPAGLDGEALHGLTCASCHNTLTVHAQTLLNRYPELNRSALKTKTDTATSTLAQMAFLKTFDEEKLAKILDSLAEKIAAMATQEQGGGGAPPAPATGIELWAQNCAGCHGGQEYQKSSATLSTIKSAISTTIPQMAYLTFLDDSKIELITAYLNAFKVDVPLRKSMLLANRFQVAEQVRRALAPAFAAIGNYENIWRNSASPHIHGKAKLWGGNCNRNDDSCVSSLYDQDEAYANPIGAPSPIRRGGLKAACTAMITANNAVSSMIGVNGLNISSVDELSIRKVFDQFFPAIPPSGEIVTALVNLGTAMEEASVTQNTKWGVIMSLLCYSPLMEAL